MQYDRIYGNITIRAIGRKKLKRGSEGYVYYEKHHILPRCLGGSNSKDNLVLLTAEEHWLAHLLLVKMYPGNSKLIYACQAMSMAGGHNKRTTNKLFGWIRRAYREATSLRQKGIPVPQERRDKISKTLKGRPALHQQGDSNVSKRAEVAKKISESAKTRVRPKMSAETKLKISLANKGHKGLTGNDNHAKLRVCCRFCKKETGIAGIGRNHKFCN